MSTRDTILILERWHYETIERQHAIARPSSLYLVTAGEVKALEDALAQGRLPLDFERKLCRLGEGSLLERYVEQNCRLIVSLLQAERQALFRGVSRGDCGRLLQVLAYVRKDEDAIPDYRLGGFKDDAHELRGVEAHLASVLGAYKEWRLRHQVPGLWLRTEARLSNPRDAASRMWGN